MSAFYKREEKKREAADKAAELERNEIARKAREEEKEKAEADADRRYAEYERRYAEDQREQAAKWAAADRLKKRREGFAEHQREQAAAAYQDRSVHDENQRFKRQIEKLRMKRIEKAAELERKEKTRKAIEEAEYQREQAAKKEEEEKVARMSPEEAAQYLQDRKHEQDLLYLQDETVLNQPRYLNKTERWQRRQARSDVLMIMFKRKKKKTLREKVIYTHAQHADIVVTEDFNPSRDAEYALSAADTVYDEAMRNKINVLTSQKKREEADQDWLDNPDRVFVDLDDLNKWKDVYKPKPKPKKRGWFWLDFTLA